MKQDSTTGVEKELRDWTTEFPLKADGGDAYYFVRNPQQQTLIIAGFGMGKMWVNGVAYEPSETGHLEFLGPLTPDSYDSLRSQNAALRSACEAALDYLEKSGLGQLFITRHLRDVLESKQ